MFNTKKRIANLENQLAELEKRFNTHMVKKYYSLDKKLLYEEQITPEVDDGYHNVIANYSADDEKIRYWDKKGRNVVYTKYRTNIDQ